MGYHRYRSDGENRLAKQIMERIEYTRDGNNVDIRVDFR